MTELTLREYVGRALEMLGRHLPHYVTSQIGDQGVSFSSSDPHRALKTIFAEWDQFARTFDKSIRNSS